MLDLWLTLAALAAPDFNADQRQAAMDYLPPRQKAAAFHPTGDLEGLEKLFLETVPAEKRTAAHYKQLGDVFTALDPEFARKQYAQAFALAPEEPVVAGAWAIELHRAGRCEEAEPICARLASAQGDLTAGLQRIDCLVRLGRLNEALEAWRAIHSLPSLGKYLRVVSERIAPGDTREHRRFVLRKAIAAGETQGVEELVFLDLMRLGGQRRFEVDRPELDADRKLIGAHLDPASRRARELWSVCDFWFALWERGFPTPAIGDLAAAFGERVRELGWLEAGSDAPARPLVARWATSALLESGLRKPGELLGDWERALTARLAEGENEAGLALLEIQRAAASPQVPETERLMWTKTHDLDAALALLRRRAERLEGNDPILRGALERYPRNASLCELAAECARREGKGEREALARQITAGFQPPCDLDRVQSAFERLEELISPGERR